MQMLPVRGRTRKSGGKKPTTPCRFLPDETVAIRPYLDVYGAAVKDQSSLERNS